MIGKRVTGMDLWSRVDAMCRKAGVPQSAFCARTGYPATSLSSLLRVKTPKPATIERIDAALARGPAWLLEPIEPVEVQSPIAPDLVPAQAAPVSLRDIVAQEATEQTERRGLARRQGPTSTPALGIALQSGFLATPSDAIGTVVRAWPDLWQRVVAAARDADELPGATFAAALERGLDALEAGA